MQAYLKFAHSPLRRSFNASITDFYKDLQHGLWQSLKITDSNKQQKEPDWTKHVHCWKFVPSPAIPPQLQTWIFWYISFYSAYIANYIKSTIYFIMVNKEIAKNPELVADLFTYIRFLEECIKYSREPYEKYK